MADPEDESRQRLQRAVGPDFRVGRLVGRGGFADVFEADDVRLTRKVAIKVLRSDLVVSTGLLERFQREARAIAALRHPNVMEIYGVGEVEGVAYFVMPLVRGESIKQRVLRGPMALDEVRRILVDAAGALDAAHRAGTVHRDVKSDNILLEGEAARVLVTDFGIAKALGESSGSLSTTGLLAGTPQYMSPEQACGDELDHRSDIYSLGVVAFEMVAGRLPFEARTAQALIAKHLTEAPPPLWSVRTDCPENLGRVVERCLAKDPGQRWASLSDFVAALRGERGAAAGMGQLGVPGLEAGRARRVTEDAAEGAGATGEGDPPVRFRRTALGAAVVALVAVLADAVVGLGGLSAWLVAALLVGVLARAARLWRAGHEWEDLVGFRLPGAFGTSRRGGTPDLAADETFGRFGSLVETCTADRATIMRAFADVPRQEQARFGDLGETVDGLVGRVRQAARRVGALEHRIADTAKALEEAQHGEGRQDTQRSAARLEELEAARDAAAREMRVCVLRLDEVRDSLTDSLRTDPSRALNTLARTLAEASQALASPHP